MPILSRNNRVPVRVSGADAQRLLNDVLTADFKAEPGAACWWALLSPQGKIQAEGLAGWHDDAFWFDVPAIAADAFLKRMKLYRLRAKVEFEDLRESHNVGWSAEAPGDGIVDHDPRHAALGFRVIAPKEATADWQNDADYARTRIGLGILEQGEDFAVDSTFPHDIGMDFLSGVDFAKGCYVGQEVVSRMKHRGTARRRPVIVSGITAETGAAVTAGTKEAGVIGRVVDGQAVAILRLDRIADPAAVTIHDNPVTIALPDWAGYRFGESSGTSDDA